MIDHLAILRNQEREDSARMQQGAIDFETYITGRNGRRKDMEQIVDAMVKLKRQEKGVI